MLSDGHVDVGHCCHLFFVSNENNFICQLFILFKEVFNQGGSIIRRSIINNDYSVIAVILVEDGLKVVLISEVLSIVEAWNNYAERYFCCVVIIVIDLLKTCVLLSQLLLNSLALQRINEGSFNVGSLQHPRISLFFRFKVLSFYQFIEFIVFHLSDYLFGVVLEEVKYDCLFPQGFLQLSNSLCQSHFLSGLLESLVLFFVCLLYYFLQIFQSLRQLREKLDLSLIIFSLFSSNFLLDIAHLRRQQFDSISRFSKEGIEGGIISLNANNLESQNQNQDYCAYDSCFLNFALIFFNRKPFNTKIL